MSNELDIFQESNFQQAVKVASTLAKSTIVPAHFRGKPEEIFACLVLGAELGFKPMQALNSIVMIQGAATLKAQTMLALAIAKIKDLSVNIEEDKIKSEVHVTIERGNDSYTSTWNDEKATAMGLISKDNYRKQKMTMYRWRGISEALKIICPDVLAGLNSTEEMSDLGPMRDDPAGQLLEAAKQEAKTIYESQRKPEDSQLGPLFLIENGKFRGSRLHEVDQDELHEYGEDIRGRKDQKPWEKNLLIAIDDFFTNIHLYREQMAELRNEVSA